MREGATLECADVASVVGVGDGAIRIINNSPPQPIVIKPLVVRFSNTTSFVDENARSLNAVRKSRAAVVCQRAQTRGYRGGRGAGLQCQVV